MSIDLENWQTIDKINILIYYNYNLIILLLLKSYNLYIYIQAYIITSTYIELKNYMTRLCCNKE